MKQVGTYKDPFSILVINPKGNIRQLHTPIRAQVTTSAADLAPGIWVFIEEVKQDINHRLMYNVCGSWYPYNFFQLAAIF